MNLVSPSPGARPMLCLKAVQYVSRCFPQVQSWDEAERSWRLGSKSDFSLKNYRPRSCSGPWRPCVNLKFCLSCSTQVPLLLSPAFGFGVGGFRDSSSRFRRFHWIPEVLGGSGSGAGSRVHGLMAFLPLLLGMPQGLMFFPWLSDTNATYLQ